MENVLNTILYCDSYAKYKYISFCVDCQYSSGRVRERWTMVLFIWPFDSELCRWAQFINQFGGYGNAIYKAFFFLLPSIHVCHIEFLNSLAYYWIELWCKRCLIECYHNSNLINYDSRGKMNKTKKTAKCSTIFSISTNSSWQILVPS